jgi:hypothetical protein
MTTTVAIVITRTKLGVLMATNLTYLAGVVTPPALTDAHDAVRLQLDRETPPPRKQPGGRHATPDSVPSAGCSTSVTTTTHQWEALAGAATPEMSSRRSWSEGGASAGQRSGWPRHRAGLVLSG